MTVDGAATYRWQHWSTTTACAVWLVVLLGMALSWVAAVLVPYYVNDLHRLPLSEVASGAHDPKDLWPYVPGGPAAGVLRAVALLVVVPFASLVGVGSVIGASVLLVRRWDSITAAARVLAFAVALVSLAIATITLSPFGQALNTWALD